MRNPEAFRFTADLCRYFVAQYASLRADRYQPGIVQFTSIREGRIEDISIRKALLTSARSSMITNRKLDFNRQINDSPQPEGYFGGGSWGSWRFEEDFIRDIFKFRELIDGSVLSILPMAVGYSDYRTGYFDFSQYRDERHAVNYSKDLDLLGELAATRVINVAPGSQLIDSFLDRYRQNRQPILIDEIHLPAVQNVPLSFLKRLRDEASDELSKFQRKYHETLMEYIANSQSLDFARLSRQINGDILDPAVRALNRKYCNTIEAHHKKALFASTTTMVPTGQVIISASSLHEAVGNRFLSAFLGSSALLILALALNRVSRKEALNALHDDAFYVLWEIGRTYPYASGIGASPARRRSRWSRRR